MTQKTEISPVLWAAVHGFDATGGQCRRTEVECYGPDVILFLRRGDRVSTVLELLPCSRPRRTRAWAA